MCLRIYGFEGEAGGRGRSSRASTNQITAGLCVARDGPPGNASGMVTQPPCARWAVGGARHTHLLCWAMR